MQFGDQNNPRDASRLLFICRRFFMPIIIVIFGFADGTEFRFLSPFFSSSVFFFYIRTISGLKNWTLNSQFKICLYTANFKKGLFASSQ